MPHIEWIELEAMQCDRGLGMGMATSKESIEMVMGRNHMMVRKIINEWTVRDGAR